MELSDLLDGYGSERQTTVKINGQEFGITYLIERITSAAFDRVEKARTDADGLAAVAASRMIILDAVTGWGIQRGGVPVPITAESLGELPALMLVEIASQLEQDAAVPPTIATRSENGASPPAKSESPPAGIG